MDFYKLLEQQYKDYKIGKGCESCPCKILRNKMLGGMHRGICLEEIIYLAKKYNIHNNSDVWLCQKCMLVSLEITKKITEKVNKI